VIASPDKIETRQARFPRAPWITACVVVAATAALAWSRVGLLDLPRIPSTISAADAGLDDLASSRKLDQATRDAIESIRASINDPQERLEEIRGRVRKSPDLLPLGNAYRMEVFRMRREFLKDSRARGEVTPKFPAHLDRQPIVFFEQLVAEHPSRETKLQLALAWVDEMLLFPALEIKAPSSVQSVDILSAILDDPANEYYVPALFARGLNHLHRPARLVWPETNKTLPDAAVRDIAKCVAIGRKLNVGSKRLQSILAMTLGDGYVKAGRLSVARSWWQIAQNLCHDDDIQQAVRRRYAWGDEEILDRLEEELDRARLELDHPMTDLAMMWN
jgi:hypothetical protein